MPQTQTHTTEQEIALLAAKFGAGPASLVPMLREIKLSRGSMPETAIAEIATVLHVSYAKVHRVASFYNQLDELDRGARAA